MHDLHLQADESLPVFRIPYGYAEDLFASRFSIFYCGCKQPKSIHIFKIECKGTGFSRISQALALYSAKILQKRLHTPSLPCFMQEGRWPCMRGERQGTEPSL